MKAKFMKCIAIDKVRLLQYFSGQKKIIRSLANDISFFNLYFHWEMFLFPLNAIIVIGVYPIF